MSTPEFTGHQVWTIVTISACVTSAIVLFVGWAIESNCKDWIEQITGKRPK